MYSTDELEEATPKFMQGVFDPAIRVTYWVFSDDKLDFEKGRQAVSKFMGARSRHYRQNYQKVFNLPAEVILAIGKDGRVTARGLPTPEQLDRQRQLVRSRKERLMSRLQPR